MLVEKENGAVGTAQLAKSIYINILHDNKSFYDFVRDLLYNPDFRKIHCLECKNHKPMYLCLKCHAEPDTPGYFHVTIKGKSRGRLCFEELGK